MPRNYAIVENGKVVNIAWSDAPLGDNWIASDTAKINDEYVDGQFVSVPPNLDDIAAGVRLKRNAFLASCDWTQVADAPVDAAVWATYRQALRDIPQQPGFPTNVTWPTAPGSV